MLARNWRGVVIPPDGLDARWREVPLRGLVARFGRFLVNWMVGFKVFSADGAQRAGCNRLTARFSSGVLVTGRSCDHGLKGVHHGCFSWVYWRIRQV